MQSSRRLSHSGSMVLGQGASTPAWGEQFSPGTANARRVQAARNRERSVTCVRKATHAKEHVKDMYGDVPEPSWAPKNEPTVEPQSTKMCFCSTYGRFCENFRTCTYKHEVNLCTMEHMLIMHKGPDPAVAALLGPHFQKVCVFNGCHDTAGFWWSCTTKVPSLMGITDPNELANKIRTLFASWDPTKESIEVLQLCVQQQKYFAARSLANAAFSAKKAAQHEAAIEQ
eukprot:3327201-Amphidinium_carterae.1